MSSTQRPGRNWTNSATQPPNGYRNSWSRGWPPLEEPSSLGAAVKGARLGAFWKYRVGDYRIIADIEDDAVRILVVRVGNRRDVYRR